MKNNTESCRNSLKNSSRKMSISGNITLEMSIIFPVILVVLFFILFMGFYMNDIVCIRAVMQKDIILMNKNAISDEEIINDIKASAIISDIDNIKINKKNNYIDIEADINAKFSLFNICKKERIKVSSLIKSNEDYVVKAKVIFDIIDDFK